LRVRDACFDKRKRKVDVRYDSCLWGKGQKEYEILLACTRRPKKKKDFSADLKGMDNSITSTPDRRSGKRKSDHAHLALVWQNRTAPGNFVGKKRADTTAEGN
jgi:hypothetical protein